MEMDERPINKTRQRASLEASLEALLLGLAYGFVLGFFLRPVPVREGHWQQNKIIINY